MNDDLVRFGGYTPRRKSPWGTRGHAPLFVDPTGQIIAVDGGRSVSM